MADAEHQRADNAGIWRNGPFAAFDFDGTLTIRDSFRAFLRWRAGPAGYWLGMARLGPAGLAYLFDHDLTKLKAAMVRVYLGGLARDRLEAEAEAFASAFADRLFRPDALEAWRRHRGEGVRLVIVTASPDLVVAPFARRLGADLLLGTRLVYEADGRVAGAIDGRNCRGAEKVRRLREALGPDLQLIAAYGDTDGDIEMLALADEGFMRVFQGRPENPA